MRKRLFYDIETSPNIGTFWQTGYKVVLRPENIIKEKAIICVSYKWEGEPVKTLTWDKKQCDKGLLKKLVKIISKADEIVAHNGDKFDLRWIKGRCLIHDIPVPPQIVTIDTLKLSRKHFRLNSHRLDYLGKILGLGGKETHSGYSMWTEILLNRSEEALAEMVHYCERDVELLEKVFNKLKNYTQPKTHYGVMSGGEKYSCPECESNNVKCNKSRYTKMGTIRREMICKECNRNYTISNKSFMNLLTDRVKWKSK